MKFDVYSNIVTRTESGENEYKETSIRKNFRKLTMEEMKTKVAEIIKSVPEDTSYFSLNVEKSYEDKLEDAMSSIY